MVARKIYSLYFYDLESYRYNYTKDDYESIMSVDDFSNFIMRTTDRKKVKEFVSRYPGVKVYTKFETMEKSKKDICFLVTSDYIEKNPSPGTIDFIEDRMKWYAGDKKA